MKYINFVIILFFVSVLLFNISGCSDIPYTGPVYSVDDVNRFVSSTGEDTICLEDGFDYVCIRVIPGRSTAGGTSITPTVRIFENRIVYIFNYEHEPILQSEWVTDTEQVASGTGDNTGQGTGDNAGQDTRGDGTDGTGGTGDDTGQGTRGDDTGDNLNDPKGIQVQPGWVVSIYYPNGRPANALPSLQGSGLTIVVLDENQKDITADVSNFSLTTTTRGDAFRFFVPTTGDYITIQVKGLIPGHLATFIVDTRENAVSLEETEAFVITPLSE